jgi:hypothetical protein
MNRDRGTPLFLIINIFYYELGKILFIKLWKYTFLVRYYKSETCAVQRNFLEN